MQRIAIAVRDTDLVLIATVVRAAAGDVYVNWPRDHIEPNWKPHTSHHASGQHHQKSHTGEKPFGIQKKPKPDAALKGTSNVIQFGVAQGEHTALNVNCDPKDYDALFEIPVAVIGAKKYTTYISVDLVEPGVTLQADMPGEIVHKQQTYTDAQPEIVITLKEIPLPKAQAS